ncbi:MAG TPA: fluoride efflux transporter CrcB [Bryobacteraceae bacterium]|jgi:CrcB protein
MERYVFVALGAALGGLARYVIGTSITQYFGLRFPLGTMVINVTGCFVIGILMTLIGAKAMSARWQPLLVVGALGGYTTFSSFGWEAYQAIRDGNPLMGFGYVALSVTLGYLAVWCGATIAQRGIL